VFYPSSLKVQLKTSKFVASPIHHYPLHRGYQAFWEKGTRENLPSVQGLEQGGSF